MKSEFDILKILKKLRGLDLLKKVLVNQSDSKLYKQLSKRVLSVYSDENSPIQVSSSEENLEWSYLDDVQDQIRLNDTKRLVGISLEKYFKLIYEEDLPLPRTTQTLTNEQLRIPTIDLEDDKPNTSNLELIKIRRSKVNNDRVKQTSLIDPWRR